MYWGICHDSEIRSINKREPSYSCNSPDYTTTPPVLELHMTLTRNGLVEFPVMMSVRGHGTWETQDARQGRTPERGC